jgi:hypothetical protein
LLIRIRELWIKKIISKQRPDVSGGIVKINWPDVSGGIIKTMTRKINGLENSRELEQK